MQTLRLWNRQHCRCVLLFRSVGALKQSRGIPMKIKSAFAVIVGVAALAACNNETPQEQAADNMEANAEMTADNMEEMADNATSEAAEDRLENQAGATREAGEEAADANRSGMDADGNSAN